VKVKSTLLFPALLALVVGTAVAAELRPDTLAQFQQHVALAEERIKVEQSSPQRFLRASSLPAAERSKVEARLRSGELVIAQVGDSPVKIRGGLIHHWVGTAFIPGARLTQVLGVVQDYNHLPQYYHPEVVDSRLLARHDGHSRISMRLREHKIITVVLDTEYDVHYGQLDLAHHYSMSRSTQVREIAGAGQQNEHALPEGNDHGFMWRLNSYWRFVQVADGVFIQCEAISLTRDVPAGLGWIVAPFIRDIPRESLQFTLSATRAAVRGHSAVAPSTAASLDKEK
jgi:hypothetical protein